MKVMLDTSVLIDVLRRRNRRRETLLELAEANNWLATSTLNIAELYAGMRVGEEHSTEALLSGLECLDLTKSSARLAGKIKNHWSKRGRTLTLADAMIASIAIEGGYALLTDNTKDFPMPELQLYKPR